MGAATRSIGCPDARRNRAALNGFGPNRDQPNPGAYEAVHGFPCACGKHRVHSSVIEPTGMHTRGQCTSAPAPNAPNYAIARARVRDSADDQLRGLITAFLMMPGPREHRGQLPKGRLCGDCRKTARYPDHRCPLHTAYLSGPPADRDAFTRDEACFLGLWRAFFEHVQSLAKALPRSRSLPAISDGSASSQVDGPEPTT